MRKLTWQSVGWIVIWIMVALFVWYTNSVSAQDTRITVCRADRPDVIRLEFHNIPHSYFVWNSDAPSWNYVAMGASMSSVPGEEDVILMDALEEDANGFAAGTAAMIVYGDDPYTVLGDVNTALCDVSTPEPVENAQKAVVVLNNSIPAAVVSTGRVCTVKYPDLILVCNG